MDFPKKQQQCLIPRYLLQYLTSLQMNHDDPTAPWGGGGGGSYTAGDGIEISDEDVISIDDTVALKSDIPSLTGYATETWVTNQGYLVKSDLSDYVTSSELITELGNYVTSTDLAAELLNYAELDDIPTKTSDLTNDSGFITSSALTGYATETWVTNQGYSTFSGSYNDLTNKPDLSIYELAADAFSGDYNDLTNKPSLATVATSGSYNDLSNKPNIPSVSGNYSGNYWTKITINGTTKSIPSGGSAPTNMVTTDTDQNITGVKTFVGKQKLKFKQTGSNDTLGFTAYNNNNYEIGNLQVANRAIGGSTYPYVTLGNFSTQNEKAKVGFRIQPNNSQYSYNFVMPYGTYSNFESNTYSTDADTTIPCAFTDGTTIVKADATGLVDLSSLNLGTSYTAGTGIDITNDTISIDNTVVTTSDLSTVATSGSYNDLTNKPTIPDAVSGTNDGTNWTSLTIGSDTFGLANGSTPANMVTTNTAQTITGTKTFKGTYYTTKINDPYYGITVSDSTNTHNIKIGDSIVFDNSTTYSNNMAMGAGGITIANTSSNPYYDITLLGSYGATVGKYTFKNKTGDVAVTSDIPTVPTNVSSFTNDAGYITGITSSDVTTALGYTPGTSNFSGDYDDLTNKPTIPDAVSGTNDGTNWTSLTIGSNTYGIPSGGSGSGPTVTKYDTSSYMDYGYTKDTKTFNIYDGLLNSDEFRIENTNPGDILLFDITIKYKSQQLSVIPYSTNRHLIKIVVPIKSTNTSFDNSHYNRAISYEMFTTIASDWFKNFMCLTIENITSASTTNRIPIGTLSVPIYIGASSAGEIIINSITHIAY